MLREVEGIDPRKTLYGKQKNQTEEKCKAADIKSDITTPTHLQLWLVSFPEILYSRALSILTRWKLSIEIVIYKNVDNNFGRARQSPCLYKNDNETTKIAFKKSSLGSYAISGRIYCKNGILYTSPPPICFVPSSLLYHWVHHGSSFSCRSIKKVA